MRVTSKLDNARLLLRNKRVSKYIPNISILSQKILLHMLKQYPFVYLKPINSAQGKGILRVDYTQSGHFLLRSRDSEMYLIHNDFSRLWDSIQKEKRDRVYIIQQGISSITNLGYPFDIRVHVTRVRRKWVIAGMVARIAEKESIVTNTYSGGISTYVDTLLTEELDFYESQTDRMMEKLKIISLHATKHISQSYPKWSEFGLDIGIDEKGQLWIYEINITPGALVFQNLSPEAHQRILKLRKLAN